MKLFIYKSLVIFVLLFLLFHLTFGYIIKSYEDKFYNFFSNQKIGYLKEKIRTEIKKANLKDKILYDEDAKLFRDFIKKIMKEINY